MKHIILMLTFFLFLTGVSEAKEVSYLQDRNGVKYEINSETPYTGAFVKKYENGQKMAEGNFYNGNTNGLVTTWYETGQKHTKEIYKDGKKVGHHTKWHENGQVMAELNYKGGKKEGLGSLDLMAL